MAVKRFKKVEMESEQHFPTNARVFFPFYYPSEITVEPVLSGPVLSGHPLLSRQLSKSRKLGPPLPTEILNPY